MSGSETKSSAVTVIRAKNVASHVDRREKHVKRNRPHQTAHIQRHALLSAETQVDRFNDGTFALSHVDPRPAERMQRLALFLASYLPVDYGSKTDPEVYLARCMSPFLMLPHIDLSSQIISNAVDSLCLAHLGSSAKNTKLIRASQDAYGRVLHYMMRAVGGGIGRVEPRQVIASCMMMALYNVGIPEHYRSENYVTHLFGAAKYAEAHGPSCLDLQDKLNRRLLMWLRFQGLLVCAAQRKKFFWDSPQWQSLNDMFDSGGSREWFPIIVPLPGILEASDVYLKNRVEAHQLQEVFQVCSDLDNFREAQLAWAENELASRPRIAAVTDLDLFDMEIEEHCFMTTSSTFTSFHIFTNSGQAMHCIVSWFLAVISDCTLLRLMEVYPLARIAIGRTAREVEQKAFHAATEICRSVYYYSKFKSMAYVDVLRVLLDVTRTFFEEYGANREVGWCQACLIANDLRMQRVKTQRTPTLCRVGDLFGSFESACRYRTLPAFGSRGSTDNASSTQQASMDSRSVTLEPATAPHLVDSSATPKSSGPPTMRDTCPVDRRDSIRSG